MDTRIAQVVKSARKRFAAAFEPDCDALLTLIEAAASGDTDALGELQLSAHRLAGRAGIMRFPDVGKEAACLETTALLEPGQAFDAATALFSVGAMRDAFRRERAEPVHSAAAAPITAAGPAAGSPKVLLADDDEMQRFLLGRVLQRAGFEVVTVDKGGEVIERARAARPDVIVLDVRA